LAFWDFTKEVIKQAKHEVRDEDTKVIPGWAGILMTFFAEYIVWILSGREESNLSGMGFDTV
jgi:hypothetical protein